MTVHDLIKALEAMPQDFEVFYWVGGVRVKPIDVVNVGDCVDIYEEEETNDK